MACATRRLCALPGATLALLPLTLLASGCVLPDYEVSDDAAPRSTNEPAPEEKICPEGPGASQWIDDMEDAPVTTCTEGPWFAYINDSEGGYDEPDYAPTEAGMSPTALVIRWYDVVPHEGDDEFPNAGFAMSFYQDHTSADLSQFNALRFSTFSTDPRPLNVMARTRSSLPVEHGGTCAVAKDCFGFPRTTIEVGPEWQQHELCFADFEHPDFGTNTLNELPGAVIGFGFETEALTPNFATWLDDLQLVAIGESACP